MWPPGNSLSKNPFNLTKFVENWNSDFLYEAQE